MDVDGARAAIASNDLDDLIRIVDSLASGHRWDEVLAVRDLARRAFDDTGRQMWPAASWAEYRVALHGPIDCVAEVLQPDAGFFAPGPLAEVAAQHHTWESAGAVLAPGPMRALFAYECAARGEIVEESPELDELFGVPVCRARWEPEYLVPVYRVDGVDLSGPDPIRGTRASVSADAELLDDSESREAILALRDLVTHWGSDAASISAVAVVGDASSAIAALTGPCEVRLAPLSPQEAVIRMAWAAAESVGGSRRRGAAAGRDGAWHAARSLAGFDPGDHVDPDELGEAIEELRWYWYATPAALSGHALQLAVEDPDDGVAFALSATVSG